VMILDLYAICNNFSGRAQELESAPRPLTVLGVVTIPPDDAGGSTPRPGTAWEAPVQLARLTVCFASSSAIKSFEEVRRWWRSTPVSARPQSPLASVLPAQDCFS
jgi:hypothetical protein